MEDLKKKVKIKKLEGNSEGQKNSERLGWERENPQRVVVPSDGDDYNHFGNHNFEGKGYGGDRNLWSLLLWQCETAACLPACLGSGLCQIASRGIDGVEPSGFIAMTVYLAACAGYALHATPAQRWYFVIKLPGY
jgi:hypothetical protein